MKIELNETNVEIIIGLHCYFNDYKKIVEWLKTPIPILGNIKPAILMENNNASKLLEFIDDALDNNGKIE